MFCIIVTSVLGRRIGWGFGRAVLCTRSLMCSVLLAGRLVIGIFFRNYGAVTGSHCDVSIVNLILFIVTFLAFSQSIVIVSTFMFFTLFTITN